MSFYLPFIIDRARREKNGLLITIETNVERKDERSICRQERICHISKHY